MTKLGDFVDSNTNIQCLQVTYSINIKRKALYLAILILATNNIGEHIILTSVTLYRRINEVADARDT